MTHPEYGIAATGRLDKKGKLSGTVVAVFRAPMVAEPRWDELVTKVRAEAKLGQDARLWIALLLANGESDPATAYWRDPNGQAEPVGMDEPPVTRRRP